MPRGAHTSSVTLPLGYIIPDGGDGVLVRGDTVAGHDGKGSPALDWPCLPREGEGLDIAEDLDPVTVESVGCDLDGHLTVYVGRVALDDIQVAQLRKAGWRMTRIPRHLP